MLRRAGEWFLRSGIQEPGGSVARFYRSDLAKNARVSTEITGYAVSTLFYLAERTSDTNFTEAAVRAARFLTRSAWNTPLSTFPFEHCANGDQKQHLAYFFDCGIIVRGLLAAWRATRDQEFLDVAVQTGDSMLVDFQARHAIHPIVSLPEKRPLAYERKWSASPGCYQLKSAMAWQDLFEETGQPAFRAAYESALENAVESARFFLPGELDREKVMDRLHAYAYFLEGLLPCPERVECARALSEGIARTEKYLNEIEPMFVRSDVYAQLLRIRLFAAQLGIVPLDETQASREAAQAAGFQLQSSDPRIDGGFAFGRRSTAMLPFVNPVSTGFCLQALALWSDHLSGALNANRHALV